MIFLTVGAQMPFDRLVRAVDTWAARGGNDGVFAQIGRSAYRPAHLRYTEFLDPRAFREAFTDAGVIVAHAGMGTIINALELRKPILVMPRRGDLAETRNDHQLATAQRFRELGLVEVALDERELTDRLDDLTRLPRPAVNGPCVCGPALGRCPHGTAACATPHAGTACPHLLSTLRDFVATGTIPAVRQQTRRPETTFPC
jgi:UDP-N-acetylglucosamine transferase subunit ALG13